MIPSQKNFYERKEDRLRQLAPNKQYQDVSTAVIATGGIEQKYYGQVMILTACNILSRWARCITVDSKDCKLADPLIAPNEKTLHERIYKRTRNHNPYCNIGFSAPEENDVTLQIGHNFNQSPIADFTVDVDGWGAIGYTPKHYDNFKNRNFTKEPFIPAAQLASSLGVAQLFKIAVGQPSEKVFQQFRWNLWNHTLNSDRELQLLKVPTDSFDIGSILQVGVGAVGSNVLYFLSQTSLAFELTLVDHDVVEIENLDRSLLFGLAQAYPKATKKVQAAKNLLKGTGVRRISTFLGTWDEFVEEKLDHSFDIWLALANEEGAWQSMAQNYPPLTLQATTSNSWGIAFGRHIPFHDYCLRCRFKANFTPQTICSAGGIANNRKESNETEEHASLPFLSSAAASLIVAEMYKLQYQEVKMLPNYAEANLKWSLSNIISQFRKPESQCPLCRNWSEATWEALNSKTKYFSLKPQT